jgi:hypothetical protein
MMKNLSIVLNTKLKVNFRHKIAVSYVEIAIFLHFFGESV